MLLTQISAGIHVADAWYRATRIDSARITIPIPPFFHPGLSSRVYKNLSLSFFFIHYLVDSSFAAIY